MDLYVIRTLFEDIKKNKTISYALKSRLYAGLMTVLETDYNISAVSAYNKSVSSDVMDLYLEISSQRIF